MALFYDLTYTLNTVTTIKEHFNIERNFTNDSFTHKEKVHSFYLFQKELNKDKFFIGRLSGNETLFVSCLIYNIEIHPWLVNNMLYGAGIQFTNYEDIMLYKELYNKSVLNTTLLGIWDVLYAHTEIYLEYLKDKNVKKICAQALEPYYFMNEPIYNLNNLLKGKKILIITSHKETTILQIDKVDKLFNKPIFDNNAVYIYKPSQQNGGNHDTNSWIYHYNLMTIDILKIKQVFDFDLALVSAGGFGMLLCNFIYENTSASVIYVGGPLQLYFGIMGKRWEDNSEIKKCVNDNWTYPLIQDKPQNIELCEQGCYW